VLFQEGNEGYTRDFDRAKSKELRELLPMGFGMHHAGASSTCLTYQCADACAVQVCCERTATWSSGCSVLVWSRYLPSLSLSLSVEQG
jgi:hypothetical protein